MAFSLNTAFKNLGTDLCYGLRFITNDDPIANTIEADKQLAKTKVSFNRELFKTVQLP